MANCGSRTLVPPRGPPCPTEQHGIVSYLVVLLRSMDARAKASAGERERLLTEIEFLRRELGHRLDIAQELIQKIRGDEAMFMAFKEVLAEFLGSKEPEANDSASDDLENNILECFGSLISTLAAENTKLKTKLKEVESQTKLAESTQQSAEESNADVRKLKQAYKTMVSEKDKELSALQAEGSFAWHQMEKKYKKQAAEAAEKLKETVHEFQSAAQEKDDEIGRLRAEVASGKENMSILQNELEQMRSLVKSKDNEAGQLETSQKSKKDPSETNRKSKVEGPAVRKKSRTSQVTPVGREVKTTRKCISSLKETQSQSGNSSRKHNTEGRGQSETTQNRKRGSYTLSHDLRRCSKRLQGRPAASPTLFGNGSSQSTLQSASDRRRSHPHFSPPVSLFQSSLRHLPSSEGNVARDADWCI